MRWTLANRRLSPWVLRTVAAGTTRLADSKGSSIPTKSWSGSVERIAFPLSSRITTPQAFRVLVTANTARERQSRGLLEALRAAENDRGRSAASERPAISTAIAGDLNTWSTRETALRLLLREFPDSPPVLQEPTRGPFPTDHLLFRRVGGSGVGDEFLFQSYRRIDATYYSDHNPIIALFRFGG